MISIIDYGMGNLRSVQKAFEFLGYKAEITSDYNKLLKADKIVLPGVGAFADAVTVIRQKGIDEAIYTALDKGICFLGICLGMQLIFDKSYENGEFKGLEILHGEIKRLSSNVKIPHIGWNNLIIEKRNPLFEGIEEKPYVYFVHSYHLETDSPIVSACVDYGGKIQVAVQKDNIFAVQFHPEKSGKTGLKILKNFAEL